MHQQTSLQSANNSYSLQHEQSKLQGYSDSYRLSALQGQSVELRVANSSGWSTDFSPSRNGSIAFPGAVQISHRVEAGRDVYIVDLAGSSPYHVIVKVDGKEIPLRPENGTSKSEVRPTASPIAKPPVTSPPLTASQENLKLPQAKPPEKQDKSTKQESQVSSEQKIVIQHDPRQVTVSPIDVKNLSSEKLELLQKGQSEGFAIRLLDFNKECFRYQLLQKGKNESGKEEHIAIGAPIEVKSSSSDFLRERNEAIYQSFKKHLENRPIEVKGSVFPIDCESSPKLYPLLKDKNLHLCAEINKNDILGNVCAVVTYQLKDKATDQNFGPPLRWLNDTNALRGERDKEIERHVMSVVNNGETPTVGGSIVIKATPNTNLPDLPLSASLEKTKWWVDTARQYNYQFRLKGVDQNYYTFELIQREYYAEGGKSNYRVVGSDISVSRQDMRDPSRRDAALDVAFFSKLRETDIGYQQALARDIGAKVKSPQGIIDLVRQSAQLSMEELAKGYEFSYANALAEVAKQHMSSGSDERELSGAQSAYLHLLQRVERESPGYLQGVLQSHGPEGFQRFLGELAVGLTAEKRSLRQETFLDKNTKVLALYGDEGIFDPQPLKELTKRFRSETTVFRQGQIDDAKNRGLYALQGISGNTEQPSVIWISAHGSPGKVHLNSRTEISYSDFAVNMLHGAKKGQHGEVSFSHLTFVLDGCDQYPAQAQQMFQAELTKRAQERGLSLVGYPRVITAGNRGAVSFSGIPASPSGGIMSHLLYYIRHHSQFKDESLKFDDLLRADRDMALHAEEKRRTILVANDITGRKEHSRGQEPAFFNSKPEGFGALINEAAKRASVLDKSRPKFPMRSNIPLEVSMEKLPQKSSNDWQSS